MLDRPSRRCQSAASASATRFGTSYAWSSAATCVSTVRTDLPVASDHCARERDCRRWVGMAVCMFDDDTQGSDASACEGEWAANCPAVTRHTEMPAVEGVADEVGTITGVDGGTQVSLNGWPLYYYAGDAIARDVDGEGADAVPWVLTPAASGWPSETGRPAARAWPLHDTHCRSAPQCPALRQRADSQICRLSTCMTGDRSNSLTVRAWNSRWGLPLVRTAASFPGRRETCWRIRSAVAPDPRSSPPCPFVGCLRHHATRAGATGGHGSGCVLVDG